MSPSEVEKACWCLRACKRKKKANLRGRAITLLPFLEKERQVRTGGKADVNTNDYFEEQKKKKRRGAEKVVTLTFKGKKN